MVGLFTSEATIKIKHFRRRVHSNRKHYPDNPYPLKRGWHLTPLIKGVGGQKHLKTRGFGQPTPLIKETSSPLLKGVWVVRAMFPATVADGQKTALWGVRGRNTANTHPESAFGWGPHWEGLGRSARSHLTRTHTHTHTTLASLTCGQ